MDNAKLHSFNGLPVLLNVNEIDLNLHLVAVSAVMTSQAKTKGHQHMHAKI